MGLHGAKDIESRFSRYVEGLVSVIGHADRVGPLHDYCIRLGWRTNTAASLVSRRTARWR